MQLTRVLVCQLDSTVHAGHNTNQTLSVKPWSNTQQSVIFFATNALQLSIVISDVHLIGLPQWSTLGPTRRIVRAWSKVGNFPQAANKTRGEIVLSRETPSQWSSFRQAGPKWLFHSDFQSCSESAEIWHVYFFCLKKRPCVFFQEWRKIWTKLHQIQPSPLPLSLSVSKQRRISIFEGQNTLHVSFTQWEGDWDWHAKFQRIRSNLGNHYKIVTLWHVPLVCPWLTPMASWWQCAA